ncbi:MAG: RNA-binding transcriptional accessory protein [Candidatus Cloacimonetes bacterium 4572_55]|nr:MAG: RNA-binding transcriptional accessory protein [Candidatus Cloacimonetes bacterium 4572_55]
MLNIALTLSKELSVDLICIQNVLDMIEESATVPFMARYRKERTGEMDEINLRYVADRYEYLTELEGRKKTVLKTIEEKGLLTEELKLKIESCLSKTSLEDLYLPFKPRKRTRSTMAKERGLLPLSDLIKAHNRTGAPRLDLIKEASKFISDEKKIHTVQEALRGASDILAEETAEKPEYRAFIRDIVQNHGYFASTIDEEEFPEGATKYEMYREFRIPVKEIAPHNMLALRRGETEGVLCLNLEFDRDKVIDYLESKEICAAADNNIRSFYSGMIRDSFDRLMRHSLITEARLIKKKEADTISILNFEANLRQLLLASPAGMKPTLGIDPGFRTGCKAAVIDRTGKFVAHQTIFPHSGEARQNQARRIFLGLIDKYHIELVAVGNGTAGRETDEFVRKAIESITLEPVKVMVSEAGASVYSASQVAIEEFPDLDVTIRGAISIARRLQDPLAELVKIDPKSIGVGQYQHDVNQRLLKKKLKETIESCVNFVGVDLNLASKELLGYISGVTPSVARNIVAHRNKNGAFRNRRQLLDVRRFGPKAYEQSSGFLRIREGDNPLDNSAVHPESYGIVKQMSQDLGISLGEIVKAPEKLRSLNIRKYITETVGEPTLRDIVHELQKPGRDPRAEFRYASFKEGVTEMKDLKEGMILEGTVTNVTNFGAFIDVGVKQDGLVHISQLANFFVKDPREVVDLGDVVKVKILAVNQEQKRINLSMKALIEDDKERRPQQDGPRGRRREPRERRKPRESRERRESREPREPKEPRSPQYTIDDLKEKFGSL